MAPAVEEADEAVRTERLKSALWFHIGQAVDKYNLESSHNATPQFIAALMELVYAQIVTNAATDLSTFAKHAKRSTITSDDVLLLARRNEALEVLLRKHLDGVKAKRRAETGPRAGAKGKAAATNGKRKR